EQVAASEWRWPPTPEALSLAGEASGGAPAEAARAALALGPGDWPGFRGPNRDGGVSGLRIATDWSAAPPKLLWRRRVGPAWSSVIVVGDRLFTQEQRGEQEMGVCYEASTGNEGRGPADPGRFWEAGFGPRPGATPPFAGARLFTLGATGILNCLEAATGQRYWSHDVAAEAPAKPPTWGYSSSPLVVEDKVIVFAGGEGARNLLAYGTDTGEPAWAAAASHDSYSSPHLATIPRRRQCLLLVVNGLTAGDPP